MKEKDSYVGEKMVSYAVNTVSIHEAKTNFSKLVKRAEAGETIYVGAYGKPEAILTAVNQKKIDAALRGGFIGCMAEETKLPEGWEVSWTDEEIEEMFYSMKGLEDFIEK